MLVVFSSLTECSSLSLLVTFRLQCSCFDKSCETRRDLDWLAPAGRDVDSSQI